MKPYDELTVADLMTTAVITRHARDPLGDVVADMRTADIRHLPVVDDHQHIVGIVSDRDVLRATSHSRWKGKRIGEIMTREVRTVTPETSAREAARLLIDFKIGALPVVGAGGELVGVVTESDFLRMALRVLSPGKPVELHTNI